jgi:hypothetical protein
VLGRGGQYVPSDARGGGADQVGTAVEGSGGGRELLIDDSMKARIAAACSRLEYYSNLWSSDIGSSLFIHFLAGSRLLPSRRKELP